MSEARSSSSLVQRCVIIHRDDNGYGLTVSGDNPVYVQSVKKHGAADKSGVQLGDQIIKVNGMLVTQSNHIEVVRLIKSGSFVALTLLGKDNASNKITAKSESRRFSHSRSKSVGNNLNVNPLPQATTSPASSSTTLPSANSQNDNKIQDIERNLNQERDFHHRILGEYMRAPSQKSQQELAESQTRINALEHQLNVLTGAVSQNSPGFSNSSRRGHDSFSWMRRSLIPSKSLSVFKTPGSPSSSTSDIHKFHPREGVENQNIQAQNPNHIKEQTNLAPSASASKIENMLGRRTKTNVVNDNADGPTKGGKKTSSSEPKPYNDLDQMFQDARNDILSGVAVPMTTGGASVMSMEDDEFDFDEENFDDHGPFVDLLQLKNRPAHLSVFLHFLMSNSNPSALFFWLVTDIYSQEQGTMKDLRKWAYEIYSVFIGKSAPLKLDIGVNEELAIEQSLEDTKTAEERLKHIFSVARSIIFTEVDRQLAEFRNKRALGLGGLFGDHQLEDDLDRNKELKVIEQTLLPHLEALLDTDATNNDVQSDRNSAMASALATFMKQVKVSGGRGNTLERCRSFVEKKKPGFGLSRRSRVNQAGHTFVQSQYTNATLCGYCNNLLWGIGYQGYKCTACDYNVHLKNCLENLTEQCKGRNDESNSNSNNSSTPNTLHAPNTPGETSGDNDTSGFPQVSSSHLSARSIFRSESMRSTAPALNSDSDDDDYEISDVETEIPTWQETLADKKILKKLKSKEIKRQEVIHELMHTEKTHVRNLRVMNKLFYRPLLKNKKILEEKYIKLIFPNIEDLLTLHETLLYSLNKRASQDVVIDNVADVMIESFGGEAGESAKDILATFCKGQKYALEQIKRLKFTNKTFGDFLLKQEMHPLCRRLKFTDIIAKTHQRLVKYPLLLERVGKATSPSHDDFKNLENCAQYCKDILNHVNNEIKEAEDNLRLIELNKKVEDRRTAEKETDEEENTGKLDFTKHQLVYEGDLEWKNGMKKMDLHLVLLNDILVILTHKQDDRNKYVLKNHTVDSKVYKPVIKIANIFIRDVAINKKAFFLISNSKSGSQIYEFGAHTETEQKHWVRELKSATDLIKGRDSFADRGRRGGLAIGASSPQPPVEKPAESSDTEEPVPKTIESTEDTDEPITIKTPQVESEIKENQVQLPTKGRMYQLTDMLTAKDDAIKKLLEEKYEILAEMSGHQIPELFSVETSDVGLTPADILLSAIAQATSLTGSVNQLITDVREETSEDQTSKINESCVALNELLTSLLVSIQSRDNQLETLHESFKSARSTIEHMKNGSTSDDPFVPLDETKPQSPINGGVPVIHEEEENGNKGDEKQPNNRKGSKSADGGGFLPLGIKASPFGFRKRPSDPTMERLSPSIGQDQPMNRASSFSGTTRKYSDK